MENNIENSIVTEEKNSIIQELIQAIKHKLEEKILVIDRFEGNFAVCEDRNTGKMQNIEISKLPENARESDVIQFKDNKYELNEKLKKEIQEELQEKMKNLFND